MKRFLVLALTCMFLLSASFSAVAEQNPAIPDFGSGTPWPDIDLDGVVTEDTPVSLKDNFALYANKDLILTTTIPEGYPYGGTLMEVNKMLLDDTTGMFRGDAPSSHDAKLAYDLFWLMMDWDGRNAQGVAPLKEMTDRAEEITSMDDLAAYLTEVPTEEQLFSLWTTGLFVDPYDASRYILTLDAPSLLLDDSAEYSQITSYGEIKKEARSTLVRKMLTKIGYSEEAAEQKIGNCLDFETRLAPSVATNLVKMSAEYAATSNNHWSRDELRERQGNLPILDVLEKNMGYPEQDAFLVPDPACLAGLNELWTEENIPLLRDFLIVHGVITYASRMDRECYEWSMECNNLISGSAGSMEDEVVAANTVSVMLAWPVARLYTEVYLRQEDKERITAVVNEVVDAYHGILSEAEWLSEETRAKAIEKLDAIGFRVLYPDSWEDYSCEELNFASAQEGGTFFEAQKSIVRFIMQQNTRKCTQPVNKAEWNVSSRPNVFNCAYDPQGNTISICGAYARGSIYNSEMRDEELYARVGTVIGHEISHAFDSAGALFDKDGNLANWWTEADWAAFSERNEKLAAYYNAMQLWEGQHFYGSIMTGEACADMGGMKCVLRIAAGKPEFDYDVFFRSYAGLWMIKDSLQMAYARLNDSHPMGYLRINGTLQQFDEFLNFYGITEGDGMYLAPEDRVSIW